MKKIIGFTALTFAVMFGTSCTKEKLVEKEVEVVKYVAVEEQDPTKGILNLKFNHTFNGNEFKLKTELKDANNNSFYFDEIRYWISNIKLVTATGQEVAIPNSYFLVEHRDSLAFHGTTSANAPRMKQAPRKRVEVAVPNIPVGVYTKIKFAIGVDEFYNSNFALSAGELDINQMAQVAGWAWKTSYIFLRTKGTYLPANGNALTDGVKFVAETGGNTKYREIEIDLGMNLNSVASVVSVCNLSVEVEKLFTNLNPSTFNGTKPSGWTADPNLTAYGKFINASADSLMTILANNKNSFIKK